MLFLLLLEKLGEGGVVLGSRSISGEREVDVVMRIRRVEELYGGDV